MFSRRAGTQAGLAPRGLAPRQGWQSGRAGKANPVDEDAQLYALIKTICAGLIAKRYTRCYLYNKLTRFA